MSSNETFQSLANMEAELEVHDYVVGRMKPDARRAFEARLAQEPALASAVAEERALAAALARRPEEAVPASAFEQLAPRLEQLTPHPERRPRPLKVIAAVAAACGLFTIAISLTPPPQPEFRTLSDPAPAVTSPLTVRVIFAISVDAQGRAALAERYGFLVLEGPEASGAYLVQSTMPVDASVLGRWRADPGILFAETAQRHAP